MISSIMFVLLMIWVLWINIAIRITQDQRYHLPRSGKYYEGAVSKIKYADHFFRVLTFRDPYKLYREFKVVTTPETIGL